MLHKIVQQVIQLFALYDHMEREFATTVKVMKIVVFDYLKKTIRICKVRILVKSSEVNCCSN